MPKFDIKEHDKRMREIMNPIKPVNSLANRLRGTIKKRKPKLPRL